MARVEFGSHGPRSIAARARKDPALAALLKKERARARDDARSWEAWYHRELREKA